MKPGEEAEIRVVIEGLEGKAPPRAEGEFFAPEINVELGIPAARPPPVVIKVIPPKPRPPPPPAPKPRPPPPPSTADALVEEAAFEARHREQFHPGLAYVPPAPRFETPAAKPLEVLSSLRAPGARLNVARLARTGLAGGPTAEEAIEILRSTSGTADEASALRYLLRAHARAPLAGPLREELANLLAARGDRLLAFELLRDQAPPPDPPRPERALDVDAPLDERGAAKAAAEAEQVLAEDLDAAGVRARHARLDAIARAGRLTIEAFRAEGGLSKRDELHAAASALERSAEPARAAETYALARANDEARRLGLPPRPPVPEDGALARIAALDRRGRRIAALAEARALLRARADMEVALFARNLEARLVRGPVVDLVVRGEPMRAVLGDEVTIGRTGATIPLGSPAVSRRHLRLARTSAGPVVEDLGSHNGTWLAGARLAAPLPVGDGVTLAIAREISLSVRREGDALALEVAGVRYVTSLGVLRLGPFAIAARTIDGEPVVELTAPPGGAWLGEEAVDGAIQLSLGDKVRVEGPDALEVGVDG